MNSGFVLVQKTAVALISIAGFVLVWYATSIHGLGLTPDSAHYLATARNVAHGYDLVSFDHSYYCSWPPLYPMIIACLLWIPVDIFIVLCWVHALCFGLLIWCSTNILNRYLCHTWLTIPFAFTLFLSLPLFSTCVYLFSEPVFILLLLVFIWMIPPLEKQPPLALSVNMGLMCSLLCLQRYMGIIVVFAAVPFLYLFLKSQQKQKKWRFILLFLLISCCPLTLFLIRNFILTNSLTGFRGESSYTLYYTVNLTLDIISSWFLFDVMPSWIRKILLVIMGCYISFSLWRYSKKQNKHFSPFQLGVMYWFLFVYILWISLLPIWIRIDGISNRFLSPLYPIIITLLFISIDKTLVWIKSIWMKRIAYSVIGFLFCFWCSFAGFKNIDYISHSYLYGSGGFNTETLRTSALIQQVKEMGNAKLFSNKPEVIYLFTEKPVSVGYYKLESKTEFIDRLVKEKPNHLIWFHAYDNSNIYSIEELRQFEMISNIIEYEDGCIAEMHIPFQSEH